MSIFGWLRRLMPLPRQAHIAAVLIPARLQYQFALKMSRLQGRVVAARGGNGALTEALMRDHWLRDMTRRGAFPIPWRLQGRDVLERFVPRGPVLYCWTHLPLGEMPLRPFLELGYPSPVVVADPGRILAGNKFIVFGLADRAPALPATLHVLARMRTCFQQGRSVVCLADADFAAPLSPNALRIAGKMHVPVIFQWAELAADGVMDVTFQEAPHPYCENDAAIQENLQFLREANHRVLRSLHIEPRSEAVEKPAVAAASQPSQT